VKNIEAGDDVRLDEPGLDTPFGQVMVVLEGKTQTIRFAFYKNPATGKLEKIETRDNTLYVPVADLTVSDEPLVLTLAYTC